MDGVYWGPGAVILSQGGSRADPLVGRLHWDGAGRPRRSPRTRLRRGQGQAGRRGLWVAGAGLTSVFAAVANTAPSSVAEAASHPRPQGEAGGNSRGRGQQQSDGSGRVGPAASGSGRAAAAHPPPCQRDSARPGPAHPLPHPALKARVQLPPLWVPRIPRRPTLRVLVGRYAATINRRPVSGLLPPARLRPRARGPAPRDSSAADELARAHLLPRPLPPTLVSPAARDPARKYSLRLRGHTPFRQRQAARPSFFPHSAAEPQILPVLESNVARLG